MIGGKMLLQSIQRPSKLAGHIVLIKPPASDQVCFLSTTAGCIMMQRTPVRTFIVRVVLIWGVAIGKSWEIGDSGILKLSPQVMM